MAVIDAKASRVIANWPVAPGGLPVGMALDVDKNRLFTGCRGPQKLIVMSSKDGRVSSHMAIGESVDAVQFDHGRAFASTPLATVFVAGETSPGNYMYASA